ncbi:MAG: carnitine dehydratase [Acidimicrobiales bacterium]|nr:carnitine dehydratase [Acidimicrobiales bacterium]
MTTVTERRAPLDGVLVADFSRVLAGPLATMVLADLGADVVKVERPGVGDDTRAWGPPWRGPDSTYSLSVNRNKRSVTLDLTDEADLVLARRLADRADVVVENFRPGAAERMGLGYVDLSSTNPGLVYASISGFGRTGTAAQLGGYDFLLQAVSGLMSVTGPADGEPYKVGVALVDVICGLYTAIGVLAALQERSSSGRGQQVEVSLLGSALASLVNQASAYLGADVVPGRMGNGHPSIAPYETLAAADRPVAVAVGSDRLFGLLCGAIGRPELATDARYATNSDRVAHRDDLAAELVSALREQPAAHWVRELRALGIPAGLVNDVAEAFAEATDLGADPVVETYRTDGSMIPTVRSPLGLSATPVVVGGAPPALGEHDAEVRRWLQEVAS